MKLVSYMCTKCTEEKEEYFNDSEEQPEFLEEPCKCGGAFRRFNLKANIHRVYIEDSGGID